MKYFGMVVLSIGLLALMLFPSAGWAQSSTAQITGTVKDQSGAVLPGAEVTATQTDTGVARNTISNETGSYVLANLPIGPYKLEVSLPGFRTFVQSGIILQVNSNPVINATLEVGQVSEQVEVQANAALVETRSTSVGQVIENERILELPLNGRQVTDLIVYAGAAVPQGSSSSRSMQGGQAFSVAGGVSFGVAYVLDGAMHNNPYDNLNLPLPFPDALQEFKVETSSMTANQGMHSGASVNSVTKAGTNEIHGDVFEFVRNYKFNARDYFALRRDTLKRNQFGGTIGGPIMKNKLFFFGGYQGTITRSDPSDNISYVPTAAVLSGDWTAAASRACNSGTQRVLRAPFQNLGTNAGGDTIYRADPALYSKAALSVAAKLPRSDDPCGKITYGRLVRPNEGQYIGKSDYQLSSSHSMFGRYMATTFTQTPPYEFSADNVLVTTLGGRDNLAQSWTFGDTKLIGSNIVNSLRLAVNRTAIHRTGKDFFSAEDMGVRTFSYTPHYMLLGVSGYFSLGGGTESEATFRTTTYQIGEDLNVVRGNHQMSFGANVAHWRSNSYANVRSPGQFTFDGTNTNIALGDFMLGRLTTLVQSNPNTLFMKQWYVGLYGQDTWKVSPRVTLNAGVRWEPFLPQTITNGAIFQFDLQRFVDGVRTTRFKNAPVGLYYPGDPGFPGKSGMYKIWDTFSPRVGLSWDPSGDGKTVVRAGYGISYDFVNAQFFINSTIAPPFGGDIRVNSPGGGLDNPWRDYPGGVPFPYVFDANAPFVQGGAYLTVPYRMNPNTVHNWNLTVQRQVGSNWLVQASYLGSQAVHLWVSKAINPGTYNPTAPCTLNNVTYNPCSTATQAQLNAGLNDRRPLKLLKPVDGGAYGPVDIFDDGGTQQYAGMLLTAQRRFSRGMTISSNYTWSRCIGDLTQGGSTPNLNSGIVNPNNRRFDRANCGQDRRHIFNLTGVAEMPKFANPTLNKIASGWRLSGIYAKRSGSFLTVTTGTDIALSGVGSQRPNQVLASPYVDNQLTPTATGALTFINRAAFASPALGQLGNMGRNNIEGPSFWNFDMALSRIFQIREGQRVETRVEAFNVTNSLRPDNPSTALNSAQFGTITGSSPARVMQFALKYVF